jgi:hypothetical protein
VAKSWSRFFLATIFYLLIGRFFFGWLATLCGACSETIVSMDPAGTSVAIAHIDYFRPVIRWHNLPVYYVFFFLFSLFVSSRRWSICGRWICSLGSMLILYDVMQDLCLAAAQQDKEFLLGYDYFSITVLPSLSLLLGAILVSFFGGDIGDSIRRRRERQREAEEFEELYPDDGEDDSEEYDEA